MTSKYNTVSFETAQRLHEAGVKLDTAFWYFHEGEDLLTKINTELDDKYLSVMNGKTYKIQKGYMGLVFAPTFSELLNILPKEITMFGEVYRFSISPLFGIYTIGYGGVFVTATNGLTEAAAELLLLLKEMAI